MNRGYYQAIRKVVHHVSFPLHQTHLSLRECRVFRERLSLIKIQPEHSLPISELDHHIPWIKITVPGFGSMYAVEDTAEFSDSNF